MSMVAARAQQLDLPLDPTVYELERARWREGACRLHFGSCQSCGRHHEDNGKPLLVARQFRARRFLCFLCYWGTLPRRRLTG